MGEVMSDIPLPAQWPESEGFHCSGLFFSPESGWFNSEQVAWNYYCLCTDENTISPCWVKALANHDRTLDARVPHLAADGNYRANDFNPRTTLLGIVWMLWLVAKNPSYPLLCLEDPTLPAAMIKSYGHYLDMIIYRRIAQWSGTDRGANEYLRERSFVWEVTLLAYPDQPLLQKDAQYRISGKNERFLNQTSARRVLSDTLNRQQYPDILAALYGAGQEVGP